MVARVRVAERYGKARWGANSCPSHRLANDGYEEMRK